MMPFIGEQNGAPPYMLGVYLAVNAVADAYLVVDGPDCALLKGEFIYGNHDLFSTLYDASGDHRLINTHSYPTNAACSREGAVEAELERALSSRRSSVVLLSDVPFCTTTGTDYDRLARLKAKGSAKPVLHLSAPSLASDWLEGYEAALAALARSVDLSGARPAANGVAIVGYLLDRNERDHAANLAELRRLLGVVGLDVVSIWLDGSSYADLSRIKNARTILSLPYGREAARILARRLRAKLVELDLPFGAGATEEWLRAAAAFRGLDASAE
jgi:hypothetical protein